MNISEIKKSSQYLPPINNDKEDFSSFMDTINNAIGNKAKYDFSIPEEKTAFIDNYLEELIFCMYNDAEFHIELLDIPNEIAFFRDNNDYYYSINKYTDKKFLISKNNRKIAQKKIKNNKNGIACCYIYHPINIQPIFLVNFDYVEDKEEREVTIYKKVIYDFIELKNINCLENFRRVIADSLRFYKNNK